jgi:hypothetical protein
LWDKYVYGLIIFLLFCLLGGSIFITFIYTPYLFSHYSTKEAGEIVSKIFPLYFKSGWIIGIIIYTLVGALSVKEKEIIKKLKWFVIATTVLILISMALDRAILPIAEGLKSEYYDLLNEGKQNEANIIFSRFKTFHGISSVLNLINIIIEIFMLIYILKFLKNFRKSYSI